MKIQIASDLHLEFEQNKKWMKENPFIQKGDILVLAGDIIVDKYKKEAKQFYEDIENKFQFIVETMGNHEFYGGDISYAYPSYYKELSANHHKLNNKSIIIQNSKFIVSTLWSHVHPENDSAIEVGMNDYKLITKKGVYEEKESVSTLDTNKLNNISIKYIEEEVKKPFDGKIIVVTHHMPSRKLIPEKYSQSKLNDAFVNDLDDFIINNPQINLWICGHTHAFCDMVIGKTRVVCNPLGYVYKDENISFKKDFCIEI